MNEEDVEVDWTVKTVLSDLVGKFYIDAPRNKSGLKPELAYPKIHSLEDSYIYYDKVKDGVYKRPVFSFKVDPFQLDSLFNYKHREFRVSWQFKCTNNSSSI